MLRAIDHKADQQRKTQFIMKKKESNSKSLEQIMHIRDYKKCCKTCKEADEYLTMKKSKKSMESL
jgi:hypothetical protein